jgi:hypothetical protein
VQRPLAPPTVVVNAVVDRFALSQPSHVRFHVAQGYTLSMAKQVLSGQMDTVIQTVEHNVPVRASLWTGMMMDTFIFFIKSPSHFQTPDRFLTPPELLPGCS